MNTKEDIARLRSEAEERRSNAIYELHQLHDDISTKADQVDGLIVSVREALGAGEINVTKMISTLHEARRTLEDIQNDVGQASREANTAETFVAVPVKPVDPSTGTVTTADEAAVDVDGRPIWEDEPSPTRFCLRDDPRYPFPDPNPEPTVFGVRREPSRTEPTGSVSEQARQEAAAWRRGYEDGLLNRQPLKLSLPVHREPYERGYKDGYRAFALARESTIRQPVREGT